MQKPARAYTLDEIRELFLASGTTVTDWAALHGFDRQDVYSLLQGRTRGNRGKAHLIAVALGLKLAPEQSPLLVHISRDSGDGPQSGGTADAN